MRVEIRKRSMQEAVIITFHTKSRMFDSDYERNKFFRELHGWNQVIPKQDKKYTYRRNGILDEVPHVKIADSVFMVGMEHLKRMNEFFDEWRNKVEVEMMNVMVEHQKMMKKMHEEQK